MVWVIVADIFGTGSGDSAARKLCNTAPSPDSSYSYYERLRDNISSSYNATLPSFASRRISEAPTYELKWNEEVRDLKQHYLTAMVFYRILILASADILLIRMATVLQSLQRA